MTSKKMKNGRRPKFLFFSNQNDKWKTTSKKRKKEDDLKKKIKKNEDDLKKIKIEDYLKKKLKNIYYSQNTYRNYLLLNNDIQKKQDSRVNHLFNFCLL